MVEGDDDLAEEDDASSSTPLTGSASADATVDE